MTCRCKVQRHLVNQFRTLEEAEDFYKIGFFEGQQEESSAAAGKATSTPIKSPLRNLSGNLSPIFHQSPLKNVTPEFSTGDLIKLMMNGFLKMTRLQREQFLSYLFCIHLSHDVGINDGYVPANFWLEAPLKTYKLLERKILSTFLQGVLVNQDLVKVGQGCHLTVCLLVSSTTTSNSLPKIMFQTSTHVSTMLNG